MVGEVVSSLSAALTAEQFEQIFQQELHYDRLENPAQEQKDRQDHENLRMSLRKPFLDKLVGMSAKILLQDFLILDHYAATPRVPLRCRNYATIGIHKGSCDHMKKEAKFEIFD